MGWSCVRGEEVWGGAVLEGRRCGVELCYRGRRCGVELC